MAMSLFNRIRRYLGRKTTPQQIYYPSPFYREGDLAAPVTIQSALTMVAVYGCVRVIATTFGHIPWPVMRERPGGGADRDPMNPAHRLLNKMANPEMPAGVWRETMLAHGNTWGNGYSEIVRAPFGPAAMWIIQPDHVQPKRDADGQLVYEIMEPTKSGRRVLPAADVFHLRGMGFDGLVGYSPIEYSMRPISIGIAMDQFVSAFFSNGAQPGGFIKPAGIVEPGSEEEKAYRESFEQRHKGARNAFKLGLLPFGAEFVATSFKNVDSQTREMLVDQILQVCRVYGVPPHKIFELSHATWDNIGELNIDFVQHQMPWVRRLEQEADMKLLGNADGVYTRMNLSGLLRGDPQKQGEYYRLMHGLGAYSANRILELQDENPIGPDGDKHYVPVNLIPVDQVEAFWSAKSSADVGGFDKDGNPQFKDRPEGRTDDETMGKQVDFALREFFHESLGSAVRKEAYFVRDAVKKTAGDRTAYALLVAEFIDRHAGELTERLQRPARSYLLCHGGGEPNGQLTTCVQTYCAGLRDRLLNVQAAADPEQTMLDDSAERVSGLCAMAIRSLNNGRIETDN